MYSRFIVWQNETRLDSQAEIQEVNTFRLTEKALDIRFRLKGYGFKKIGETNRVVYHFGYYKCYYRKVGETEWALFSHVQSERAGESQATVYADVSVGTGVLEFGLYEIKIEACQLVELSNWSSGVVEGISAGDQFYYAVSARQQLPNKVGATEDINVGENFAFGCDPIPLEAVDPDPIRFDGIQYVDLCYVILEHNIYGIWEEFNVQDVLNVVLRIDISWLYDSLTVSEFITNYLDKLYITPANYGDTIYVAEYRNLVYEGHYAFWTQNINVAENVAINIYGFRAVYDFIFVDDTALLQIPFTRVLWENISVNEFAETQIPYTRTVWDLLWVSEYVAILFPYQVIRYETIHAVEYLRIGLDAILVSDTVNVAEYFDFQIPFSRLVFDTIAVSEAVGCNFDKEIYFFDEVYVTDNIWILVFKAPRQIEVYEFTMVSDLMGATLKVDGTIEVFEQRGVWEYVFLEVTQHKFIYKADDIYVWEYVSMARYGDTSVTEAIINVTEYVFLLFPYQIVVADTLYPVFEFVKIGFDTISRYDNITISEFVSCKLEYHLEAFDDITVSEFATPDVVSAIVIYEVIPVAEYIEVEVRGEVYLADNIAVTEIISLLVSPNIAHNIIENITVTEIKFVRLDVLNISSVETITITENTAEKLLWYFNIFDGISTSEFISVSLDRLILYEVEGLHINEYIKVDCLSPSVKDNIFIAEVVTLRTSRTINVSDSIGVVELAIVSSGVYVSDSIHIAENVALIFAWVVSVSENISVQESVLISMGIQVSENIDVSHVVNVVIAPREAEGEDNAWVNGALTDDIQVQEYVALYKYLVLPFSVTDSIAVTEYTIIGIDIVFEVGDETGFGQDLYDIIFVADIATMSAPYYIPREIENAYEDVGVYGALYDSITVAEFIQLERI